jgi:hypothetical protein
MRMSAGDNASAQAAATAFAGAVARLWQRELGPQLLGFYLIGSLAHGGFSSRYSDIDVLLIADDPPQGGAIERVAREAAAQAPALAELRAYLAGDPFRNWSQQALRFSALEALSTPDYKRYPRAILYPARFLYSWEPARWDRTMRQSNS